jgi:hypothetical protein
MAEQVFGFLINVCALAFAKLSTQLQFLVDYTHTGR